MPDATCDACERLLDGDDNFCRRCGAPAQTRLPAARPAASVTLWRPPSSPVVKGAAVMAAGTVGQFVLRRALSSLLGQTRNSRQRRPTRLTAARRDGDGMLDEAEVITETVMLRRVRIRRQA